MENRNRDVFGQARGNAVLDAIREALNDPANETGKTPPTDVLDQIGRKAVNKKIEQIGEESERRFTAFARRTEMVKSVQNANPHEDVYRGIDKWILLREDQELPGLPVQVKSSYRDRRIYKYGDNETGQKPDPAFRRLHGMEIVLNCGPSVNLKAFKKQLHEEIRRIRLTLKGDPSLVKYIKR